MDPGHSGLTPRVSTTVADLMIEDGGILLICFKPDARLNAECIDELIDAHVALADGRKHPTLADVRNLIEDDHLSRKLGAGPRPASVTSKLALLVGSPLSRLIGNFFVRVSRPAYPTRLFSEEELARRWLMSEPDEAS